MKKQKDKTVKKKNGVVRKTAATVREMENKKIQAVMPVEVPEVIAASTTGEKIIFSNVLPMWQFIALSFFTFGIYEIYWFYRNWKHFKKHKNLDISPGWRTVILFVPVIGLIYIYRQLEDIQTYGMEAGVKSKFLPGVVLLFIIIFNVMVKLPAPYWLIATLSFIPTAFVQVSLNEYWMIEQPGMPVRNGLPGWQVLLLIVGILWMFLVFVGLFLPKTA